MPAEGLEIRKIFIALSEREREAQKKKRDTTYKIYAEMSLHFYKIFRFIGIVCC